MGPLPLDVSTDTVGKRGGIGIIGVVQHDHAIYALLRVVGVRVDRESHVAVRSGQNVMRHAQAGFALDWETPSCTERLTVLSSCAAAVT